MITIIFLKLFSTKFSYGNTHLNFHSSDGAHNMIFDSIFWTACIPFAVVILWQRFSGKVGIVD